MDPHGGVEVTLGRPSDDGYGDALNELPCVGPHHVRGDYPIVASADDELHEGALLPARERVLHGAKHGFIDRQGPMFLPGKLLGGAHGADIGLAEDRRGDQVVVHRRDPRGAELGLRKGHGLADGDGGKLGAIDDVP